MAAPSNTIIQSITLQLDTDNVIVALELQLEEIESHDSNQKGKHRVDRPPDFETASGSLADEIKSLIASLKLVQSMSRAEETDGALLAEITRNEAVATEDKRLALQLGGDGVGQPQKSAVDGSDDVGSSSPHITMIPGLT